jgi:ferric-dicitrate binding protein FerR (iron transport regulator)
VVEDIGTKFDVRAYSDDAAIAVAVAEGAVALGRAGAADTTGIAANDAAQGVVLREGELGTLDASGRVATARGDVVASYLAWADGRLRFVEAPLPDVLRAVGRWFDLDVRAEGRALASQVVTAEFDTQSGEGVLKALALSVNASVTRSGKVVTLHPK